MKTLVIYTEIPDEQPKLALFDGDLRHLNGIYINSSDDPQEKQDEVYNLFYDAESDAKKEDILIDLPFSALEGDIEFDFIIQCGFLL